MAALRPRLPHFCHGRKRHRRMDPYQPCRDRAGQSGSQRRGRPRTFHPGTNRVLEHPAHPLAQMTASSRSPARIGSNPRRLRMAWPGSDSKKSAIRSASALSISAASPKTAVMSIESGKCAETRPRDLTKRVDCRAAVQDQRIGVVGQEYGCGYRLARHGWQRSRCPHHCNALACSILRAPGRRDSALSNTLQVVTPRVHDGGGCRHSNSGVQQAIDHGVAGFGEMFTREHAHGVACKGQRQQSAMGGHKAARMRKIGRQVSALPVCKPNSGAGPPPMRASPKPR